MLLFCALIVVSAGDSGSENKPAPPKAAAAVEKKNPSALKCRRGRPFVHGDAREQWRSLGTVKKSKQWAGGWVRKRDLERPQSARMHFFVSDGAITFTSDDLSEVGHSASADICEVAASPTGIRIRLRGRRGGMGDFCSFAKGQKMKPPKTQTSAGACPVMVKIEEPHQRIVVNGVEYVSVPRRK